jgi:hypothetical protein
MPYSSRLIFQLLLRDTTNRPSNLTSDNGKLVLGYLNDGDSNEHLDMGKLRKYYGKEHEIEI